MTVVEYRLGLCSLFKSAWNNVKWIPFFLCVQYCHHLSPSNQNLLASFSAV